MAGEALPRGEEQRVSPVGPRCLAQWAWEDSRLERGEQLTTVLCSGVLCPQAQAHRKGIRSKPFLTSSCSPFRWPLFLRKPGPRN